MFAVGRVSLGITIANLPAVTKDGKVKLIKLPGLTLIDGTAHGLLLLSLIVASQLNELRHRDRFTRRQMPVISWPVAQCCHFAILYNGHGHQRSNRRKYEYSVQLFLRLENRGWFQLVV